MNELKENLGRVIGILFMSRTYAHVAHLKTTSYATHKALNDFYDDVVGLSDKLAEVSQGSLGLLEIPAIEQTGDVGMPLEGLKQHLIEMEKLMNKSEIGFINNVFEEIQALYSSTFYKLTFLK